MEEAQGALQRAEELRSYRMQNVNEIVLPNNFGAGLGPDAPDSPLSTVINTVGTLTRAVIDFVRGFCGGCIGELAPLSG